MITRGERGGSERERRKWKRRGETERVKADCENGGVRRGIRGDLIQLSIPPTTTTSN